MVDINLTDHITESLCFGVVELKGIPLIAFLHAYQLLGVDFGNTYLETKTKDKVNLFGGSDLFRSMCFTPSKAKSDIWMRENKGKRSVCINCCV